MCHQTRVVDAFVRRCPEPMLRHRTTQPPIAIADEAAKTKQDRRRCRGGCTFSPGPYATRSGPSRGASKPRGYRRRPHRSHRPPRRHHHPPPPGARRCYPAGMHRPPTRVSVRVDLSADDCVCACVCRTPSPAESTTPPIASRASRAPVVMGWFGWYGVAGSCDSGDDVKYQGPTPQNDKILG